jgi:hypothetical protein
MRPAQLAVRARARADRTPVVFPATTLRRLAPALALAGAFSVSACSGDKSVTPNATAPGATPGDHEESVAYVVDGITYPTIAINPRENTMSSGQTASLHSVVSSPSGSWNGREVTYTSSNTSVVTVQTTNWGAANGDTGRVTAVANGTAVITATTESGTIDTLHVTVGNATQTAATTAPDALSGCGAPNLVTWDFSSQNWGPLNYTSFLGDGQVVSDPTTSTGYSAMWTWTNSPGVDEGGQVNAMFANSQAVYARFAYKQDANFPDGGIKKILRFRAGGFNQLLGTLDIDNNQYIWFYDVLDGNTVFYQSAGATPEQNRGSWHWFEVYNNISQSGNLQFKVWLDGQVIISGSDPVSNQGLSFGMASPGGTFNAPAGVGTDYITDIGASTECIGPPW